MSLGESASQHDSGTISSKKSTLESIPQQRFCEQRYKKEIHRHAWLNVGVYVGRELPAKGYRVGWEKVSCKNYSCREAYAGANKVEPFLGSRQPGE